MGRRGHETHATRHGPRGRAYRATSAAGRRPQTSRTARRPPSRAPPRGAPGTAAAGKQGGCTWAPGGRAMRPPGGDNASTRGSWASARCSPEPWCPRGDSHHKPTGAAHRLVPGRGVVSRVTAPDGVDPPGHRDVDRSPVTRTIASGDLISGRSASDHEGSVLAAEPEGGRQECSGGSKRSGRRRDVEQAPIVRLLEVHRGRQRAAATGQHAPSELDRPGRTHQVTDRASARPRVGRRRPPPSG